MTGLLLAAMLGVDLAITETAEPMPPLVITESVAAAPVGGQPPKAKAPHLIATVADKGCGPCEKFEREELPRLLRSGWRVDVRKVPFGSEVVPAFELRGGSKWVGYSNVAAFEARLAPPSKAPAKVAAPVIAKAAPVRQTVLPAGWHSHRCSSCGSVWSHPNSGGSHRCPSCGRSQYRIYQRGPQYRMTTRPAVARAAFRGCVGCGR